MLNRISGKARSLLSLVLYAGIDDSTPTTLVDRVVYSNWVCLLGTFINLVNVRMNMIENIPVLLAWNFLYQSSILACWFLNKKKFYLAGRLTLLTTVYLGIAFTSAIQGPAVQTEHYLLALAVLSFTLFHPSERQWSWLFGALSATGFLFFVNQSGPVLDLRFAYNLYMVHDKRSNQYLYTSLYVLSLFALSNAYARAIKVADRQRAKLFESSRMAALGQMAGGVAHEINNPLAIILALTETLAKQAKDHRISPEEIIKTTDRIQSTAFRIVHIVRGLQVFSRDGEKLPFTSTSVNQIIDDTVALCHERFKSMGIKLSIQKAPNETTIDCRAVQVSQVLINLLNNACDATRGEKEKWVEICAQDHDSYVKISVRNGGEKISPLVQENLFQPFFTTKEIGHGTGLGLSVSLGMMREHGGSVYLDTQDLNTAFVVTLPKTRARH